MKLTLSMILLLISSTRVYTQITLHKSYRNSIAGYNVVAHSATITHDSGMLILGQHFNTNSSGKLFILKTDKTGNRLWSKSYDGFVANVVPLKAVETIDHGFAVTGFFNDNTVSLPNGDTEAFILKINDTGAVVFAKRYGGMSSGDAGYSVLERPDKGLIMVGSTSQGVGPAILLISTDSIGNTLWTKTYSYPTQLMYGGYRREIIADSSGYFIATVAPTGNLPSDLCLLKVDNNGNFQWGKSYGGLYPEILRSFTRCSDGGFLLGGHGYSFTSNHGNSSGILMKTDSLGTLLWTKHFSFPEVSSVLSVQETKDRSILIGAGGESNSLIKGMRLLKLDDGGNLLWAKNYGNSTTGGGMLYGTETLDGKAYFVVGQTNALSLGDYYLVKTDSSGHSGCLTYVITPPVKDTIPFTYNIYFATYGTLDTSAPLTITAITTGTDTTICYNVVNEIQDVKITNPEVYPNPSSGIFTFFSATFIESIEITSITGKSVYVSSPNSQRINVNLSSNAPGIYFYTIKRQGKLERGKILLQ